MHFFCFCIQMYQSCLVLFVNSLIILFYSSYFLLTLKESNKEKAPETITLSMPYARYTGPLRYGHGQSSRRFRFAPAP